MPLAVNALDLLVAANLEVLAALKQEGGRGKAGQRLSVCRCEAIDTQRKKRLLQSRLASFMTHEQSHIMKDYSASAMALQSPP